MVEEEAADEDATVEDMAVEAMVVEDTDEMVEDEEVEVTTTTTDVVVTTMHEWLDALTVPKWKYTLHINLMTINGTYFQTLKERES